MVIQISKYWGRIIYIINNCDEIRAMSRLYYVLIKYVYGHNKSERDDDATSFQRSNSFAFLQLQFISHPSCLDFEELSRFSLCKFGVLTLL